MYYHIRLDPIFHDGRADMNTRIEWDFRTLEKALTMIGRDFGIGAACWYIQHLSESEPTKNIMHLDKALRFALESTHQSIVMYFNETLPLQQRYDHFEFFVVLRDEIERPPAFSFTEEEEAAMQPSRDNGYSMLDLYNPPIDATRVESWQLQWDDILNAFIGVKITLKDGGRICAPYGVNQKRKTHLFDGRFCRIDKTQIAQALPVITNEPALHGFTIRLTSGETWCIPLGVPLP